MGLGIIYKIAAIIGSLWRLLEIKLTISFINYLWTIQRDVLIKIII